MKRLLLLTSLAICSACGAPDPTQPDPGQAGQEARHSPGPQLAKQMIIVDTHIDAPYAQFEEEKDLGLRLEGRDFDHPRARDGGLDVAFMSIYVPASYQEEGGAKEFADHLIDMVETSATAAPEKFAITTSTAAVQEHFRTGKLSLAMGMENGAPIQGDLENLRHFYDRGIRYITLTHSRNNHICDSSYAEERQWNGLSPFGREVVAEMNRLGIMIDVSHISDQAFQQVMELSRSPAIASHSSCRKFTPGWERNMGDDMIRLLAEKGGVIQINFGSAFLLETAQKQSVDYWTGYRSFLESNGAKPGSPEAEEYQKDYWSRNSRVYADILDVVAHIDHVVAVAGVDHVGLGSDFDGVGDSLPTGLKDVSQYPNLIDALQEQGYSETDIRKICGGNLLRVWQEVESVARDLQIP